MTLANLLTEKIRTSGTLDEAAQLLEVLLSDECEFRPDGSIIFHHRRALVDRFQGLRISILPREHPPPHFHVMGKGINASFSIVDGTPVAGEAELSTKQRRAVLIWYKEFRPRLIAIWNTTRPSNCPVGPINDPSA